jgi:serine phosphatase RsbU (regulator of sigma subunit)
VLRAGREATSADAGSIAVLTPDGSEFVTLGLVGYSEEVARSFGSYPADAPLPMPDCLRDGPLWLSDAGVVRRRYPHLKPFHAAMRHEAVAALPLRAGGRAIGGLALSFLDARRFDEEERTQLLAVADLCAQALDRARLYEEQRREAERERFLAEASTILATPLDPRETLAALARTAVPRLADWCSVSMERDGEVETVALAHVDPEKVALAERFTRRFPSSLSDPDGVGAVIRTGTSQLASVVTPELIEAAIPPGPRRDAVLELGLASVMTVPLRARGHTVGALVLASSNEGRRFGSDDLRFAEELGSRAGLAIENAALLDRSRRVSQMLQSSLLPARLPTVPGLDVAARYIAGGEGVDVGGDFYDLFAVPDEGTWIAVLGDVCGKGPEAAALTSLVRYTVRADAVDHPPGVVLERLNRAVLRQVGGNRFTTATCVRMSVGEEGVEATVVRGGHPPSVLVRADGRSELVQPGGPLIGVLETVSFESLRVRLAPGDALVLFSDGVTEARSPERDFFGIDRLVRAIRDASGGTADEIAGAIEGATDRFRRGAPRDDVAILVLRAGPAGGPGTDAAHGGR